MTNFSSSPNVNINYSQPPLEVRVQLLQPEHPVPCFYLSLIVTVLAQLHTNPYANHSSFAPHVLMIIYIRSVPKHKKISPAAPIFEKNLEQLFISG